MCLVGLKSNTRSVNYILSALSDEGHLRRKSFSCHLHSQRQRYIRSIYRFNNNRTSSQFAINLCKASDIYLITLNQFSWIIDDIHKHKKIKLYNKLFSFMTSQGQKNLSNTLNIYLKRIFLFNWKYYSNIYCYLLFS